MFDRKRDSFLEAQPRATLLEEVSKLRAAIFNTFFLMIYHFHISLRAPRLYGAGLDFLG
jgi:hypothetical protein